MSPHRCACVALLFAMVLTWTAAPAWAGPPAYLLLRRPESPGPHYAAGYHDAASYDVRTSGYAYGYFGVAPRVHASRHFGYYRTYTQWTFQ